MALNMSAVDIHFARYRTKSPICALLAVAALVFTGGLRAQTASTTAKCMSTRSYLLILYCATN
jgi:hypothetical protein